MKSLLFLIALFITFPLLSAELEFEEVYQIHPESGLSSRPIIYLKGDTVLLLTSVYDSNETDSKWREVISESYDEGMTWNDLTEFIGEDVGISVFYEEGYHQLGRFFIKPVWEDNSIKYFDLNGNMIKEIYHFNSLKQFERIYLNQSDENFIGVFFLYDNNLYDYYDYSNFNFSIDKGKTWSYVSPASEMKKQGQDLNGELSVHRIISPSLINPKKYYFFVSPNYHTGMTQYFTFDYQKKKYTLLGEYSKGECFECLGENKLSLEEDEFGNSISYDILTKETQIEGNFYNDVLGINLDSAINSNPKYDENFYERIDKKFHTTNILNPFHQIVGYTHYQYDNTNDNIKYPFVHQYFYQTFDNGDNWELIYSNKDKDNLVYKVNINPIDNKLWLIKGIQNIPSEDSKSTRHTIYKSKTPLTNVEVERNENTDFNILIKNESLYLTSPKDYTDAFISIYDLNGKLIQKLSTSLVKGNNSFDLINFVQNKLTLVSINVNDKTTVIKVINQ